MNTNTISLSSLGVNEDYVFSEQTFYDVTQLKIDISDLSEIYLPLCFKIDWGDGVSETFQNDLFKDYTKDSIISEVLYGKFSPLFARTFSHRYLPSISSNTKSITAILVMVYPNDNSNTFTIPITISTYDYFEAVGDIKLKNTNITEDGNKEHQFITEIGGSLIEIATTVK